MHDVPAAGAETELDRGRVHHHVVALAHRAGEVAQHVRTLRTGAEIDLDPLQPGALLEQSHDVAGPKRGHRVRLA